MHDKRSDFPCPGIISDVMRPGRSQLDGRMYDSRSAYEAHLQDRRSRDGKDYQIVGNDYASLTKQEAPKADEKRIDAAITRALEKNGAI
jgi:hypothetical protein